MRGKGFPSILYRVYMQDHPRLCGEKNFFGLCQHQYLGSPPPMRGKVFDALDDSIKNGITPAYAGKSSRIANIRAASEDNPRLCGEKCFGHLRG